MKHEPTSEANLSDSAMDALLRISTQRLLLPATFNADVWRRIEAAERASPLSKIRQWIDALLHPLMKPIPAVVTVVIAVTAGLGLGARGAGQEGKLAYVELVSPFIAPHEGGHEQ